MDFLDEPRQVGQPVVLGVLGTHSTVRKEDIHETILHPLMSVLGRLPDKLLLPDEGQSSAYLTLWAERHGVDAHPLKAEWTKFQRKAGILRDARILKEATHLLVFVGPRFRSYEQTGIRQLKKGKRVFLVERVSKTLERSPDFPKGNRVVDPNPIEMYEILLEDGS